MLPFPDAATREPPFVRLLLVAAGRRRCAHDRIPLISGRAPSQHPTSAWRQACCCYCCYVVRLCLASRRCSATSRRGASRWYPRIHASTFSSVPARPRVCLCATRLACVRASLNGSHTRQTRLLASKERKHPSLKPAQNVEATPCTRLSGSGGSSSLTHHKDAKTIGALAPCTRQSAPKRQKKSRSKIQDNTAKPAQWTCAMAPAIKPESGLVLST